MRVDKPNIGYPQRMPRLRFFGSVIVRGTRWLLSLTGLWGKVLALIAIAGVSVGAVHIGHFPAWLVVAVAAALVVIFLGEGAYQVWHETDEARRSAEKAAAAVSGPPPLAAPLEPLQPRYDQSEPYRHPRGVEAWQVVDHRIGILNPSEQEARRVQVHLVSVHPVPRNVPGDTHPVTPYVVPPLSGGDGSVGVAVAPGRQELWPIGYTAPGSDGSMNAGGFAGQRWMGTPWRIDPDERLRFGYEIIPEGHPIVRFSIVLYPDSGVLRCQLEG
jgi:hypothetical protein